MMRALRSALRKLSLQGQLLVLLAFMASMLVIDRMGEIVGRRSDLVEVARDHLLQRARFSAERQGDVVSDARAVLAAAVELSSPDARARNGCRPRYERIVNTLPWLTSLWLFAPDGSPLCSSGEIPPGLGIADRPYFRQVLDRKGFVLSDLVRARDDGEPAILAALPRLVDGRVEAVAVARLDLDWINGLVARQARAAQVDVILTDASGMVVTAYPELRGWTGQPVESLGLPADPAEGEVLRRSTPAGEERLYTAAALPYTGGRIFVGAARDRVLAPVERETLLSCLKLGIALGFCALFCWFGTRAMVVRPVAKLARTARRVGLGDLSARACEEASTPEIRALARSFNGMTARLSAREAELLAANERLAALATVDPLTGLANRRLFDERLAQDWDRAARTGRSLALVLVDVDRFKAFNDAYGHPAGDACLRQVAQAISAGLRPSDLAARTGGEEFAILLPKADLFRALHVGRLARQAVEQLRLPHAQNEPGIVTVSAGVAALAPGEVGSSLELMMRADKALYRAKNEGRNRVLGPLEDAEAARAAAG